MSNINWRPHTSTHMPVDVRKRTRVDVMRASGQVDQDCSAHIWNWSDATPYGPMSDPILAYRHTPQPGCCYPLS